jgi:hypothetical protein
MSKIVSINYKYIYIYIYIYIQDVFTFNTESILFVSLSYEIYTTTSLITIYINLCVLYGKNRFNNCSNCLSKCILLLICLNAIRSPVCIHITE